MTKTTQHCEKPEYISKQIHVFNIRGHLLNIVVKRLPHPLLFWRSHNRILAQRMPILTGFQNFPHTFPRKCH